MVIQKYGLKTKNSLTLADGHDNKFDRLPQSFSVPWKMIVVSQKMVFLRHLSWLTYCSAGPGLEGGDKDG